MSSYVLSLTSNIPHVYVAGTRPMYLYIREELKVPFSDGKRPIDNMLDTIHSAIKDRRIMDTVLGVFPQHS